MIRKLSNLGDDLALVIDPALLEQLGIDATTSLEISTDGQTLRVSPVRSDDRQSQFEEALAATNEQYGKALKRLAE